RVAHHYSYYTRPSNTFFHSLISPIFFFISTPPPPTSTLFPYTTLFRSRDGRAERRRGARDPRRPHLRPPPRRHPDADEEEVEGVDRKSTRLNSSHVAISYAVFCLKKKKKLNTNND